MGIKEEIGKIFPEVDPTDVETLDGKVLRMIYAESDDGIWMLAGHDKKENKLYCLLSGTKEKT